MPVLTIEETQRRHKELWLWIAKETKRRKRKVYKYELLFECMSSYVPYNSCWCCEFERAVSGLLDIISGCSNLCPIEEWGENAKGCMYRNSLYELWRREKDWQKAAEIAEQIANLPFKKAFDITPEQAKLLRDKGFGGIYSVEEV